MNVYKWLIIGLQVFGALVTVATIGKPRKPMTPGVAVVTLILGAGVVFCVVRA